LPAATPTAATPTVSPATIQPVSAEDLGPSWHPGCPIDPRHLRRVEVNYIGFDGKTHRGDLIVHEDLAAEVVAIFEQLVQLRYPIEKIRTVDNYPGADDELSMGRVRAVPSGGDAASPVTTEFGVPRQFRATRQSLAEPSAAVGWRERGSSAG
jgi:hypothetical protein